MSLHQIARHLTSAHGHVRRAFPRHTLDAIEQAIQDTQNLHAGQIRFVVEGALDGMPLLQGQSARERAIELFSQLRIWDTEDNSGVLIYLLLADRRVEIVADRGIHAKVGRQTWDAICRRMENAFAAGEFESGVIAGIKSVASYLSQMPKPHTHQ